MTRKAASLKERIPELDFVFACVSREYLVLPIFEAATFGMTPAGVFLHDISRFEFADN
jgi:hypothetical protein